MDQFDVAVVGAGPGGYVAAIRSAQLGYKTVIIERNKIGGTCLNAGCIPTKTLTKNAEILHEIKLGNRRSLKILKPEIDMPGTIKMKENVVKQLTGGVKTLLRSNGVESIIGEADVLSEEHLSVAGRDIFFKYLIIATGSSNIMPAIPGLDFPGILTSTEMLELDHVPESLAIIGGGVIGCEFATIFNTFGSKVIMIEMLPTIASMMDKEVSEALTRSLTADGIQISTNCKVTQVCKESDRYQVRITGEKEETIEVSDVLVSVGRSANLKGLESLGLEMDTENKYIKVDDKLKTSVEHVYAIGDVTGKIMLAHVASAQAIVAAENIAGKQTSLSYDIVPYCIHSIPEIGSVGLTEEKARERYGELLIGTFPMSACGKALTMGEVAGFTKLIADNESGKILGCHIMGPNATELIGQVAAVMKKGGTLTDIKETIHAHPSIGETISEAAHLALGEPIHIMGGK
ncbi:MAG: dihydrolipoyl dehydrogenase [Clostridia bacterium]|nr:dihydrolipoyl dehydrogenase [Clostridia bacterium]